MGSSDGSVIAWLGAAPDPAALGGKGASLDRLVRLGFHVPPGFCLTVDAFRAQARALSALTPEAMAGAALLPSIADPLDAALLGLAGVGAIVSPFGGRASDRRGRRLLVVTGSVISAAGLTILALPGGAGSVLAITAVLALVGLGNGLTSPRQAAALEAVESRNLGMAAGTYYTGRYLGGVVGASLAGAILGAQVTAGGVSAAFGVLAAVGAVVALVSLGLPGRPRGAAEGSRPISG
ncbi:MAG TPA: MFS transporter [Candidatus Binatia bacterium]|nr:MFS transporter [Candidatus Binatia bacterium]